MKKRLLFILSLMAFFLVGFQPEASAKVVPVQFEFRLFTDIKSVEDREAKGGFTSATSTLYIDDSEEWVSGPFILSKLKAPAEKALSAKTGKTVAVNSLIRGASNRYPAFVNGDHDYDYYRFVNNDNFFEGITFRFRRAKPNMKVIVNLFGSLNGPLNGWHVHTDAERYYENNVYKTGVQKVGNTTYLFSSFGRKQYGWHSVNGFNMYFNDQNGGLWTGKRKIGATTYLFNSQGHKIDGWHRLGGKDYFFNRENGGMWTGKRLIGRTTYLLHNDGYKIYGWFVDENGDKYYFDPNFGGGMVTGFRKVGNAYYYFDTEDGHAYKNETVTVNRQEWYFNSYGIGKKVK